MKGIAAFLTIFVCLHGSKVFCEDVFTNIVSITEINPTLFNWSLNGKYLYDYRPSLYELPDLPGWLTYTYSQRARAGFLFGVFPQHTVENKPRIQVIGLNRETYETKVQVIEYNVTQKPDPALYEIHLKIDNLDVEDMLDGRIVERLRHVIVKHLWPESANDLHMTFLASAINLGARRPPNPNERDGIVVHFGSRSNFSFTLIHVEEEVKPLWKLPSCPRDFKRTTVDRHFRDANFAPDWCPFRLRIVGQGMNRFSDGIQSPSDFSWSLPRRDELPSRIYNADLLASLVVPIFILLVLVAVLSLTLCFHHDYIKSEESEESDDKLSQYEAVQRATSTLRSMSNNRDASPRLSTKAEQPDMQRPSPPPYGSATRTVERFT